MLQFCFAEELPFRFGLEIKKTEQHWTINIVSKWQFLGEKKKKRFWQQYLYAEIQWSNAIFVW